MVRTLTRRVATLAIVGALAAGSLFQVSSVTTGSDALQSNIAEVSLSEAIRLRRELGLKYDSTYVAQTLSDETHDLVRDFYGLPLSTAEADELRRRIDVQQSVKPARLWASEQPSWGGSFTDQIGGGVPVFLFAGDPEGTDSGWRTASRQVLDFGWST